MQKQLQMLMVVFRSSLKERVHVLLHQCEVRAFTEVNETVGYGETGPAEGLAFYPGTNAVILAALDEQHVARVSEAVTAWCQEAANNPRWKKPSVRVFSWPCSQVI